MGIGLLVGSAIGMSVCSTGSSNSYSKCCHRPKSMLGKALKAMGEVAENIGDVFGL